MSREGHEWNEKVRRGRRNGKPVIKRPCNPFEAVKSEYCLNLDEQDDAEGLLQRVAEAGPEGLKARLDEFASRIAEAGRQAIETYSLTDEARIVIKHACERAVQQESELLSQTCELLADDDVTEEDGFKAAVFYYMSFETVAEAICQIVGEILV